MSLQINHLLDNKIMDFSTITSHEHLTLNPYVNVHSSNNSSVNRYESFKNSNFYPVLLSGSDGKLS